jgi:lysophospholipase L1-like esterase
VLKRFPRWLLLSVTALLLSGGLELGLRLAHNRTRARLTSQDPSRPLCTRPADDPALVYALTPGRCGANSRGFLGAERAVPKPGGVRRVVVVGDSIAQGYGVAPDSGFATRLTGLLEDGHGPIELVLLAVSGYSTVQELRLLEEEAPRYGPDLVIWSYVLNDPAHPLFHNASGELGLYHHRPRSYLAHFVAGEFFLLREQWHARACPAEFHERLHCVYRGEIQAHIRRIGEWSRAHRVPVVFAIHPIFQAGGRFEVYSLSAVDADLATMAQEAGLTVVDLRDAYLGRDPETLKLPNPPGWYDPWHPNDEGHRLAAEFLATHLRAARLPPSAETVARTSGP